MEYILVGTTQMATITIHPEGTLIAHSVRWQTSLPAFISLAPDPGDETVCVATPHADLPGGSDIDATVTAHYRELDGAGKARDVHKTFGLTVSSGATLVHPDTDVVVADQV